MTTQIAVRLPDDILDFVDGLVRSGQATSRAAVVARALERERRRAAAERDAQIYAAQTSGQPSESDDLDELAGWAAIMPVDVD